MALVDEKDPIDSEDDEELETKPEAVAEPPSDPNEPIEVVTDEARQQSRKERRAERQNEFRRTQEEAARLRAENEVLRRQPAYQPPQQQQLHPSAARLKEIDAIEDRLHKEYEIVAGQAGYDRNGPQEAEYRRQARAIQVARMAAVQQASQPQFNHQEMARQIRWENFQNDHADVLLTNDKAKHWAIGKWQQLVYGEGKADTPQLAEEILDQARVRFGMKPRRGGGSTPTSADRQRYAGVPSRAGSPSQANSGAIQMSAEDKKLARIAFVGKKINGKEMNEQQAYQHWANTVGKKRQELEKSGR